LLWPKAETLRMRRICQDERFLVRQICRTMLSRSRLRLGQPSANLRSLGAGAIYPVPEDVVLCDPFSIPDYTLVRDPAQSRWLLTSSHRREEVRCARLAPYRDSGGALKHQKKICGRSRMAASAQALN